MLRIASIVEGHGECEAVPLLIRRIAQTLDPALAVSVHPVLRVPGSRLAKQGEIERTIELAARKTWSRRRKKSDQRVRLARSHVPDPDAGRSQPSEAGKSKVRIAGRKDGGVLVDSLPQPSHRQRRKSVGPELIFRHTAG